MVVQHVSLPVGQLQARTRWGTHASGEAFDRKKSLYLTEEAQAFIAQQALCAIAGLDMQGRVSGLLALDIPGFVQIVDQHTCLLRLDGRLANSPILQRLHLTAEHEQEAHLGLFFICHPTKERLCIQGVAELLEYPSQKSAPQLLELEYTSLQPLNSNSRSIVLSRFPGPDEGIWIGLYVRQAFFHCAKYIKTRIPGLTYPVDDTFAADLQWSRVSNGNQSFLSEEVRHFLSEQILCYLCTVDQEGQCAINHRGGAKGFLVTLPPNIHMPGGVILLPDYSGNGAFEAIGNILETGQAALIVPNYASQIVAHISGAAMVLEVSELTAELAQKCAGAERVVALAVQHVEMQRGNWSAALAYECIRAERIYSEGIPDTCIL